MDVEMEDQSSDPISAAPATQLQPNLSLAAPIPTVAIAAFDINAVRTFYRFSDLPLILQPLIWAFCLPSIRFVQIVKRRFTSALRPDNTVTTTFRAVASFIKLLGVNQASRAFVLQHYGRGLGGLVDSDCYISQRMGDHIWFADIGVLSSFAFIYMKVITGNLLRIADYITLPIFAGIDLSSIIVGWSPQVLSQTELQQCFHPECSASRREDPYYTCSSEHGPLGYYRDLPWNLARVLSIAQQFGAVRSVTLVHNSRSERVLFAEDVPALEEDSPPEDLINMEYRHTFVQNWGREVADTPPGSEIPKYTGLRLSRWNVPVFYDAFREQIVDEN